MIFSLNFPHYSLHIAYYSVHAHYLLFDALLTLPLNAKAQTDRSIRRCPVLLKSCRPVFPERQKREHVTYPLLCVFKCGHFLELFFRGTRKCDFSTLDYLEELDWDGNVFRTYPKKSTNRKDSERHFPIAGDN